MENELSTIYCSESGDWKQGVRYQKMPESWFDVLPEPEHIMVNAHAEGWLMDMQGSDTSLFRHIGWNKEKPETMPKVLHDMMKHHECDDITIFVGLHEGFNSSFTWHIDDYDVWAFNILGVTKWTWFNVSGESPNRGSIMEQIVEPGYILTMPKWVSHKVDVLSEERTSISLVKKNKR